MGRSPYADIVIADPSVAEYHAEIVVADDGRVFVVDCGTASGTWRLMSDSSRVSWAPVRQDFVGRGDVLRLGEYERAVSEILSPGSARADTENSVRRETIRSGGRLSRDPATGEIVRRRS